MSTLTIFIQHIVLEVLSRAIRQEKVIKDLQIGNEKVKVSFFVDDLILYSKTQSKSVTNNKQIW